MRADAPEFMHFWRLSYSEWRSLPVGLYADMGSLPSRKPTTRRHEGGDLTWPVAA